MKIVILVLLLSSCFFGQAQKTRWGIKAGVAITNCSIHYENTPNTYDAQAKAGVDAGVFLDIPLGKGWTFQPGLDIISKGMYVVTSYPAGTGSVYSIGAYIFKYNEGIRYMELPFNILYSIKCKKSRLVAGGGLAPALVLTNGSYHSDWFDHMFDIGANVQLSYEWEIGLSVNINYTPGLTDLYGGRGPVTSVKSRSLGIRLGYLF